MKAETIHYSRFISSTEAYCGVKLNDGPGTINLRSHTILRKDVTCKNCRRKIQKDSTI